MERRSRAVATLLWIVALGLVGCQRDTGPLPLGPDEEELVQAYVRIAVLQALDARAPDSAAAALPQLEASVDSVAVRRALQALSNDPMRWELVYRAIAAQLEELEENQSLWWSVVRGDSLLPAADATTGPARLPTGSTNAEDH